MPVTFGSVGDIISVCLIVKDLVDALDKTRGSASEYQEIIRELRCLDRSLLEIERLSRESENTPELVELYVTAKQTADKCRLSINGFLAKVRRYEKYLREEGSGSIVKDTAMQVKWQMSKSSELARFRVEVVTHYASINALIATAQLHLFELNDKRLNQRLTGFEERGTANTRHQTAVLAEIRERVEDNNHATAVVNTKLNQIAETLSLRWLRDMGGELKSLMQKVLLVNVAIYKAVVSNQNRLPGGLERSLIQEPVILEDAIGRFFPVHLQFICSWEALEDVLEHQFRGLQGHEIIKSRNWALQDITTGKDIDRETRWDAAILPGQKVGMDLIFRKLSSEGMTTTSCPSCNEQSIGGHTRGIKCTNCGLNYQRITEVDVEPYHENFTPDEEPSLPLQAQSETPSPRKRKILCDDFIIENHDTTLISRFKRVRLMTRSCKDWPLPTRVLDVRNIGSTKDTIRLIQTTGRQYAPYAFLTHCLAGEDIVKTTNQNLNQRMNGILVSDLPADVWNAISVVRKMGLRFLWIDWLCIIMNDKEDWHRESRTMENIYGHSYVNILATNPNNVLSVSRGDMGHLWRMARDQANRNHCIEHLRFLIAKDQEERRQLELNGQQWPEDFRNKLSSEATGMWNSWVSRKSISCQSQQHGH